MQINFITSGFPNGFTNEFIKELRKYLDSNKSFVFIASDFMSHDKTVYYKNLFLQLFKDKEIKFENSFVIDFETDPKVSVSLIENADVVWLSGGDTLLQIKNIKDYGLVDCNIEPHLNFASAEHISDVKIAAKISPIYGLHDEAFLVVNADNIQVFGVYHLFE